MVGSWLIQHFYSFVFEGYVFLPSSPTHLLIYKNKPCLLLLFLHPVFISSASLCPSQWVSVPLPKPKLFDHKLSECNDLSLSLSLSGCRCSKSRLKSLPHYPGRSQHTISIYMRFETFSNILQQDSSVMAQWWFIKKILFRCKGALKVAVLLPLLFLITVITPVFKKEGRENESFFRDIGCIAIILLHMWLTKLQKHFVWKSFCCWC